MAEFKIIALDKIHLPERLRAVEEDHALAIQASIVEHGLINPITVRHVPNQAKGRKPYVLIAGAHRLRAVELNDETEIEALVVKADADEAQLIEITENLFRNELSALDRAMFVISYREAWERKHGKIRRGNPELSNSVNLTELIAEEAKSGFSVHVANRLGLSVSAVERAQRIAQTLAPELRQRLRGRPEADNQSLLLKLARLEPVRQQLVARAFAEHGDVQQALQLTDPDLRGTEKRNAQDKVFDRLVDAWERADGKTRARFLEFAGAKLTASRERLPKPSEVMEEAGIAPPIKSRSSR